MSNQSKKSQKKIKKFNKLLLSKKTDSQPRLFKESNTNPTTNLFSELGDKVLMSCNSSTDSANSSPDYKSLILNFSGQMDEWNSLILKTHNEFGYGFEYEDLEHELIKMIKIEMPGTSKLFNNDQRTVEEIVPELKKHYSSKLTDMLAVTDDQNGAYWRGELDEYLTYG